MKDKDETKKLAIESSMETIRLYRDLLDQLEKDLHNDSDESKQQAASLAIKTFHLFIIQEEGYNTWNRALHSFVNKELLKHFDGSTIH